MMACPRGHHGWDMEGRVMIRGTEGVERWGREGGGEGRGCGVLYSFTPCVEQLGLLKINLFVEFLRAH